MSTVRFRKTLLALLLLLFLPSCAPNSFDNLSVLTRRYDLPAMPQPEDYPDADAVVLVATVDTELYSHGDREELWTDRVTHRVTRILRNPKTHVEVEIDIFPGERLVDIEAQSYTPEGRPVRLTREEIDFGRVKIGDDAGSENQIEKNTIRFRFPAVQVGSTLEYRYRLRRYQPFLYDSWAVQERDPVLYAHYRLTVPSELYDDEGQPWEWRYRLYRCARIDAPEVYESINPEVGLTTTYLWTHRDIKAYRPEPRMPPDGEYISFVRFAHDDWRDWDAVTGWYHEQYLRGILEQESDVLLRKARDLTRGLRSKEERATAIAKFVQEMDEVDLMLGQGSLEPTRPEQVLRRRRGDVKDKAILLVALLRAADIEARPALVVTSDRGPLDRKFPNWNFNHMLVVVDANRSPIWIDPTARHHKVGDLPWRSEGVEAILIETNGNSKIMETPESRHNQNRSLFHADIEVQADSTAVVDVHLRFFGEPAAEVAETIRKSGVDYYARSVAERDFEDATLVGSPTSRGQRGEQDVFFKFKTRRFLDTADVFTQIQATPLTFDSGVELMAQEARKHPLDHHYPSTRIRTWTVDFSESGIEIAAIPSPIQVETRALLYKSRFLQAGTTKLEAEQVLEVRKRRLLQKTYETAIEITRAMQQAEASGVLLQATR